MKKLGIALSVAAGLKSAGEPLVAQYNGPWTPGLFLRNEALTPPR